MSANPPAPALAVEPVSPGPAENFGHCELLRHPDGSPWELGRGTTGVTWKAFDPRLKAEVALRQIHGELLEDKPTLKQFLRDARAAAKVRHANIASILHVAETAPFFYTMEFVPGQPLGQMLEQRGNLPVAEALNYADQIAAGLGAMARERIAHRDLTPAHILMVPDAEHPFGHLVKLTGFEFARGGNDAAGDSHLYLSESVAQSGAFNGTASYASPEQCSGQSEIDSRSDLYSLGVILWQMLTGALPFSGPLGQVLSMQQYQAPPWSQVSRLPPSVMEILRRLLEKKPADRFQAARELREAIASSGMGDERAALPVPGGKWGAPRAPEIDTFEGGAATDLPLGLNYHLVESFQEGDAGRLYRAIDHGTGGAQVAIKILSPRCAVDDDFREYVREEIAKIHAANQPIFLTSPLELEESDAGKFIVREWAEGWSLLDLLRSRRAVPALEVRQILAGLPEALDAVADAQLELAEPLLHKLFITSRSGPWRRAELPALRALPVTQWPAFRLRWNPLNFRPPYTGTGSEVTRPAEEAESYTDDPVFALARLVYELLGGRAGGTASLPSCSDHVNAMLRRALAPGGGSAAFPSAAAFWHALFDDFRRTGPRTLPDHVPQYATKRVAPIGDPLAPEPVSSRKTNATRQSSASRGRGPIALLAIALALLAAAVLAWRSAASDNRTAQAATQSLRAVAETPPPAGVKAALPSPLPAPAQVKPPAPATATSPAPAQTSPRQR